ncbi:uncharacterized protein LOC121728154 isoform X2 [Aricia agestis]|uniref:uncharacterized protein LOC121728154 isoform X2 n=1 Tax=Aricia agestis TaxID=91739 RepID=UPI001C2093AD|nr:uncharacterized protein LOC121728154 isoform X2 [Aricia agestis]
MSFQVDRLSSAWAHIARCADPTWTPEPRDAFTVANQRLLAQHCKISQVFRDLSKSSLYSQHEKTENGCIGLRSVKDVIPESRLAQFYGDFYYDDARENCYLTVTSNRSNERCNFTRYENSDQTECWMLPEVEYWFRKLTYENGDGNVSRRRRHCKTLAEEEFERWVSSGERAREETALEARIRGVRVLWQNNPQRTSFTRGNTPGPFARDPSPPAPRKMRTRRRQPRRLAISVQQNAALPNQLLCSSPTKFQLDVSRQPPLNFRRALGRLANNHQIAGRGAAFRRTIYRTAQAKCTGLATSQKPARAADKKHGTWWPRDSDADNANTVEVKINQEKTSDLNNNENDAKIENETKEIENKKKDVPENEEGNNQKVSPASSAENERKKRLYSTVLSMTPPSPVSTTPGGSRPQKFTPGLIKLNPKIVFLTRPRPSNSSKFEELEKQALEQYKPSDESIDTKFRELERQAEEQYSPSNSITSCGSHSSNTITLQDNGSNQNRKHPKNSSKAIPLDSVVIYSQNFPDLSSRGRTKSIANLKNFHTPPRGEKKEQPHRTHRTMKSAKLKAHRASSDTEYYEQDITQAVHKNPVKWKIQAKKRHLSFSVSEPSSDEEAARIPIKGARVTKKKNINNKAKVFNQGAGDLQKSKLH